MLTTPFYKRLIDPFVVLLILYLTMQAHRQSLTADYLLLGIITFFICNYVFEHVDQARMMRRSSFSAVAVDTLVDWLIIIGVLILMGLATNLIYRYSPQIILIWFIAAPIALVLTEVTLWRLNHDASSNRGVQSAVIVGVNSVALKLERRTIEFPNLMIQVRGYFDDRGIGRQDTPEKIHPLGKMSDVAAYVRANNIDIIYISQPISAQPRILQLLDDLKDTTASIYFLPDIYVFDVIQARFDSVGGIPVVAVCESPFTGVNAIIKRVSDIVLASIITLLLLPILIAIGIAVKLSSPGPIIFKQRRYGLGGEEIMVYKFRSMTTTDNGNTVVQAKQGDKRVTKLGAILRRTSLDELPQFINVLQGRMSIVGPRPHAVAHNELYRKQITGYMLRHKVRPGITGWAQVNGFRGETDTLDKMKSRIEYDLDYLRRWSLSLDLWIIVRTVLVVLKKENAY
jgi:putative colanic acid biosysnthesis UDP-glucose lipid carrier transferase